MVEAILNNNDPHRHSKWEGAVCPSLFSMVPHYIRLPWVLAYDILVLLPFQLAQHIWTLASSGIIQICNHSVIDYRPTEPHYCIPTHYLVTNFVRKLDCVTECVYFLYMNDAVVLLQIMYMLWLST